jgi:DNA-binding transcriptional MerR regulator
VRIKELADLTDSTVRTIRYYHQIGLLPVPEVRYGHRDYELTHVARLVRIRWLAQAGVPLTTIATMLGAADGEPGGDGRPGDGVPGSGVDAVLADLRATTAGLDGQLAQLQARRDQITRLTAAVERDGLLSPMPAVMVRFYDTMEARATDPRVRWVIREERNFNELACYRGDLPLETTALFEGFTEERLAESYALYCQIAERRPHVGSLDQAEIDQVAASVVDRISRHLGGDREKVLSTIDIDMARRAAALWLRFAGVDGRRLNQSVAEAILGAIEKEQR